MTASAIPITDHRFRPDRAGQWHTGRCDLCGEPQGAHSTPSQPTVTPAPQPVTTQAAEPAPTTTPDAPPLDPIAAEPSATPTEETPVPTPTESPVAVDVTAEVGP